ncbi:MAG: hypothetical protein HFG26_09735 [Provencibacterium sp.]|nr:hypothetical protein [Provencibacterium sp.]
MRGGKRWMDPICMDGAGGRSLMLVATAVAAGLAEGRSQEDIAVMAAFLDVVSDQLSLLAALQAKCGPSSSAACPEKGAVSSGPSC